VATGCSARSRRRAEQGDEADEARSGTRNPNASAAAWARCENRPPPRSLSPVFDRRSGARDVSRQVQEGRDEESRLLGNAHRGGSVIGLLVFWQPWRPAVVHGQL